MVQYYTNHVTLPSKDDKDDIDEFLKECAIASYKIAIRFYIENHTNAIAEIINEQAEYLVNHYGFSWDDVGDLEDEVMQNV
nr:MAG TPA: xylose isomerase-like TIM barrel protein [Caudoviricetes sp.]